MMSLCCEVLNKLKGKTLATAESCTGGGIGNAITAVAGSSSIFKGGIISYCDEIKNKLLGVSADTLEKYGAVSAPVAEAMAAGARRALESDIAVSATGLAGPGADEYGNPVGTVFIGYSDANRTIHRKYLFSGERESVREQTIEAALRLILEQKD